MDKYTHLKSKYPDKCPLIIQCDFQNLYKKKYLVPINFTVGQFVCVLRTHMNLNSSESILIFINNTIPNVSTLFQDLENNDIIYITITKENTFG